MELKPCPFCAEDNNLEKKCGIGDFRIVGKKLYCYNYEYGWKGIDVNFCPICGRPLFDQSNVQMILEEIRQMDGKPGWICL